MVVRAAGPLRGRRGGMASHSHGVQEEGTRASLTTLTRDGMFANSILIRHSLL